MHHQRNIRWCAESQAGAQILRAAILLPSYIIEMSEKNEFTI